MIKFPICRLLIDLASAVLFGVFYSVASFLDQGCVKINTILIASGAYFLILYLLHILIPRLRK